MGYYDAPVSAETAHGDAWFNRIRAEHDRLGAACPCGNGKYVDPRRVTPTGDTHTTGLQEDPHA